MAQAAIRLITDQARRTAVSWVWGSEAGTLVTFATPQKRTAEQNALMWALLTEVAAQVPWHGQALTPDDWKLLFLANMDRGARMVPALDGRGFVNLNTSSSALKVAEFADLLDEIRKFGIERGVAFGPS